MEYEKLSPTKGVAGLNILLSVISMLFVIGIIIMIFTIAGSKLRESVSKDSYKVSATVLNEYMFINETGFTLAGASSYLASSFSVLAANNVPTNTSIPAANITISASGVVTNATAATYAATATNVMMNYTYLYLQDRSAVDSINATYTSLGEVTDWYPTFIVLAAMVVLILLLAIIINSIRGSGLMGEGGA